MSVCSSRRESGAHCCPSVPRLLRALFPGSGSSAMKPGLGLLGKSACPPVASWHWPEGVLSLLQQPREADGMYCPCFCVLRFHQELKCKNLLLYEIVQLLKAT